jgi:hypothetical protein
MQLAAVESGSVEQGAHFLDIFNVVAMKRNSRW